MKGRALLLGLILHAGILPAAEGAESWERIQAAGECSRRGTTTTCLLRLPRREMRDLVVDVSIRDQDVGFRFFEASLGAWRLEAEGIWHAAPASRHSIRTVNTLYGGLHRLELTGSERPPRLAGVTASAREPEPVQAEPGPAPRASRAVFSLEDVWFPAAWPVRGEGVRPGDTVRLELPDEMLVRLGGSDHWELRLATPEGQLPWAWDIDELPREADLTGARWVPAERPGWLRLSLPDLPKGPPYMGIQLTAPPRPLLRRVSVEGFEEVPWSCAPEPPLPCRLDMDFYINRWPPRELPKIEMEGGEGAPLPPLDVVVWRRTERLVFVWPEQGPVRLLAGNGRVSPPDVLLAEIDPQAESRPWKPVTLGPEERLFRKGYLGGAIAATLVLAGLCLWERRRRLAVSVLLLALPAAPAQGEEVVFRSVLRERRVEVPAAGWVRVPLDMETLSSLGTDGRRLRVIGPEGEEIPSRIGLEGEEGVSSYYSLTPSPTPLSQILAGSPALPEGRTVPLTTDCGPSAASALCSLRLPARGQLLRGLTLELRGAEHGAGIRLSAAHEGRWQPLAEGIRERPAEGELELRLTPSHLSSELLRLELFGESAPPRLVHAEAHLAPASLLFSAPVAGSYRLLYGDGRAARESHSPREGEAVREIEAGPERRPPPPPGFAVEPQTSSRRLAVEAAWPVLAPGARTGEVVRLLLPAQIESSGRPGLRLESGGEEIPYVVRALDEPARETAVRFPAGEGWRTLSLPVASGVDVTGLRLEAGAPVSASIMGWGTAMRNDKWTCRPARLPCVLDVGSSAAGWREGEIRLEVGGEAPELRATVWRRQRELVFVWPGGRGLRLLAGRGASSPYDLQAIEDRLLAQPWKPARLGRGGEVPAAARSPWLRWSLIALAAVALLAVIHFMMPPETQKDRRIAGLPEA